MGDRGWGSRWGSWSARGWSARWADQAGWTDYRAEQAGSTASGQWRGTAQAGSTASGQGRGTAQAGLTASGQEGGSAFGWTAAQAEEEHYLPPWMRWKLLFFCAAKVPGTYWASLKKAMWEECSVNVTGRTARKVLRG